MFVRRCGCVLVCVLLCLCVCVGMLVLVWEHLCLRMAVREVCVGVRLCEGVCICNSPMV